MAAAAVASDNATWDCNEVKDDNDGTLAFAAIGGVFVLDIGIGVGVITICVGDDDDNWWWFGENGLLFGTVKLLCFVSLFCNEGWMIRTSLNLFISTNPELLFVLPLFVGLLILLLIILFWV